MITRIDFTDEQELRLKAVLANQLPQEYITDQELAELELRAFDLAADRIRPVRFDTCRITQ